MKLMQSFDTLEYRAFLCLTLCVQVPTRISCDTNKLSSCARDLLAVVSPVRLGANVASQLADNAMHRRYDEPPPAYLTFVGGLSRLTSPQFSRAPLHHPVSWRIPISAVFRIFPTLSLIAENAPWRPGVGLGSAPSKATNLFLLLRLLDSNHRN